jgi:amino acid transporter
LGEETREPRSTIPRAVVWSAVLVGLFYVFNYYAATVFFGPDRMTEFYTFNGGDPWGFMAEEVLPGIGGLLVVFAILNSSLANANAGATAATRSLFAMGRVSLLPRWFAAVHPERKTPVNAVHFQAISALIVAVVLGLVLANDPFPTPEGSASFGGLNVYVFLGTMLGLIFVFIYICVNLACIGYFWRQRRSEFNVIKHLIVSVLGVVAMIPAGLAVIGGVTIPILDIELPPYANALQWTAPIVGLWMVIGIVLYFVLRSRDPEALERMGDVYGGDAPAP